MSLQNYLARLTDILRSRQDIVVDDFRLALTTAGAILQARICFYDNSMLSVVEEIEQTGLRAVRRLTYKFHYQRADGILIFRHGSS